MNGSIKEPTAASQSRGELSQWIASGRTAVVIVDMQVDFALQEGAHGRDGLDMSIVEPALESARRLVAAARAACVPVVFVGLQTHASLDSPAWRERMLRRGRDPDDDSALCRAGQRGADFVGPTPLPDEIVIPKIRYSGFFGTPLDVGLKGLGVDTLVVAGLTTECCVDSTVRDAFHLDYHVFIPTDACASYQADLHESALKSLQLNFAMLVMTDEVVAAWQENAKHG